MGGVLLNAIIMIVAYGTYIKPLPFLIFQFTQATVLQFWTPDCLRGYGCGTPNGALWTIGVMVQAYIVIFALYKFLHKKKPIIFIVIFAIGIVLNIGTPLLRNSLPEIIFKLFQQTFLPYIWLFVLGALVCEYFDAVIGLLKRFWWLLFIFTVIVSVTHIEDGIGAYETIKSATLGLSILGFGYAVPTIKITHDFSYGFYIYHMIIINLMVELGYLGKVSFVLVALSISILMAMLSYYLVGGISKKLIRKVS